MPTTVKGNHGTDRIKDLQGNEDVDQIHGLSNLPSSAV